MTGRKNQRETGKKNKREDCGSIALHYLEQYTRKNSLEIQGIPDQSYSTTEEVVGHERFIPGLPDLLEARAVTLQR